jgi:hypothetical protein
MISKGKGFVGIAGPTILNRIEKMGFSCAQPSFSLGNSGRDHLPLCVGGMGAEEINGYPSSRPSCRQGREKQPALSIFGRLRIMRNGSMLYAATCLENNEKFIKIKLGFSSEIHFPRNSDQVAFGFSLPGDCLCAGKRNGAQMPSHGHEGKKHQEKIRFKFRILGSEFLASIER